MPAALRMVIGNSLYDRRYASEPEPHMDARRVNHERDRLLVGSSSINGVISKRGNPRAALERWASDPGTEVWDCARCLPFSKRMEPCVAETCEWRGQGAARELRQSVPVGYDTGERLPGHSVETGGEIPAWFAQDAETAYHPSCAARLSTDQLSVPYPEPPRPHGVERLRVVAAPAAPSFDNANIYAPVTRPAEKSTESSLGSTPLPPFTAGFHHYRAQEV
ncbi:GMC family oxidoreductase N-terminal domain-containing protein [Streptomyces spirodelae]|uniref:GMC family oxidoreductase N-terminal domain-containing protein n=1 Tax=Streptomyces spirodelae TaxID=2812904 RepID=UPI0027DD37AA|nr:GMC family oxidoreductase N-terminal domain-containing protein [Streptomyces spirodelae]